MDDRAGMRDGQIRCLVAPFPQQRGSASGDPAHPRVGGHRGAAAVFVAGGDWLDVLIAGAAAAVILQSFWSGVMVSIVPAGPSEAAGTCRMSAGRRQAAVPPGLDP
jgi:hypothetical protein